MNRRGFSKSLHLNYLEDNFRQHFPWRRTSLLPTGVSSSVKITLFLPYVCSPPRKFLKRPHVQSRQAFNFVNCRIASFRKLRNVNVRKLCGTPANKTRCARQVCDSNLLCKAMNKNANPVIVGADGRKVGARHITIIFFSSSFFFTAHPFFYMFISFPPQTRSEDYGDFRIM